MQTHFRPACVPDGELSVIAHTGDLASVIIGAIELYVQGPDDADRLIKAAVAAKEGMLAKQAEPPVISPAERDCPALNPDGSGEHCHKSGPHKTHRDSNGDTWTDAVSVPGPHPDASANHYGYAPDESASVAS